MIRTLSYILVLVCAGVLCSCISEDIHVLESEYDICFDVAVASATKSVDSPNDYPTDVPFRLWALDCSDDKAKAGKYIIEGEDVRHSDGVWKTDTRHSWPDSSNLAFFAVSPAMINVGFSLDHGITYPGFDSTSDDLFLCTASAVEHEKPETGEPVSLMFSSPFCRLGFSAFSSAGEGVELAVTGITLLGLNTTGDFKSLPEFKWSGLREAEDVVVFDGHLKLSEDNVAAGKDLYIIPQDLQIKVKYEYRITPDDIVRYGEQIVTPGNTMRPECGKWRPYLLKVTTEFVEIQKPKKYEE